MSCRSIKCDIMLLKLYHSSSNLAHWVQLNGWIFRATIIISCFGHQWKTQVKCLKCVQLINCLFLVNLSILSVDEWQSTEIMKLWDQQLCCYHSLFLPISFLCLVGIYIVSYISLIAWHRMNSRAIKSNTQQMRKLSLSINSLIDWTRLLVVLSELSQENLWKWLKNEAVKWLSCWDQTED